MRSQEMRTLAFVSALAAVLALAVALGAERWGGVVPCALCLLERWPYRLAILFALVGCVLPLRLSRWALWLVVLAVIAGAGLAVVHVGVEQGLWQSPLPECAAPHAVAGSAAQMLAGMPDRPGKPCDAPTMLIPGLPLSMAAMNLIYALAFAAVLAMFLLRQPRGMR